MTIRLTRENLRRMILSEVTALRESDGAWRDAIEKLGSALETVQALERETGKSPLGRSAMQQVHTLRRTISSMEGF